MRKIRERCGCEVPNYSMMQDFLQNLAQFEMISMQFDNLAPGRPILVHCSKNMQRFVVANRINEIGWSTEISYDCYCNG